MAPAGPPPRRGAVWVGRVTLLVGFLVLVALLLGDLGERGPEGLAPGTTVPDFAAPLVTSPADRRVNLLRRATDGVPRACDVRRPDVLNVCALREAGPFVLAFFADRGARCVRQLDLLDRLRARHPDVRIAAVALRGERRDLAALARSHGWGFPVGHDEEGYLVGVYGVTVCPQLVFGRRGGAVVETTYGELSAPELDAQLRALERG
jgi:hypothetical protein